MGLKYNLSKEEMDYIMPLSRELDVSWFDLVKHIILEHCENGAKKAILDGKVQNSTKGK